MGKLLGIFRYILPYWRYALLNVMFNLFSVIFSIFSFTMVIPFLQMLFGTGKLVTSAPPLTLSKDALLGNFNYFVSQSVIHYGKAETLVFLCIFVGILYFLKNLAMYMGLYFLAPVRTGVVKDLRNDLYKKILILPLSYFSEQRKGDIIARTTSDIQEVEWSVMRSFELFFREPLSILMFLVTLIIMSPRLTLFAFIVLPFTALIIGKVAKKLREKSAKAQKMMGLILSVIEETLSGLRIIKAFNAIGFAGKKFREVNKEYTHLMIGITRRGDLASPLSDFLGVLVVVTILWFGGTMVLSGTINLPAEVFIAYLVLFTQLINPSKSLTSAYYQVQKGLASAERIRQVLDAQEVIEQKPDAVPVREFRNELEFRDVSFAYEEEKVLDHINLKIKKGSIVALVGASGAGKSTIADLIPRFYDCSEGMILVDGTPVRDFVIDDLRGLMGIVNQECILFNDTVMNNIAFGIRDISAEAVVAAAKVANAHDFIMELENGYQTLIGDRGVRLSGGQRQRLSIARAVLRNPPILILDEATSALDTQSERLVQEAIYNLMKNRTSVVIAHRLSTIQNADEIIVLDKGRIVQRGTHTQLIDKEGIYRKLCMMQSLA